ncbi:MAG: CoB--CoM heterodisulfide reductase iron-sulfur subunit B family protein [Coriobacteriales bacterium]|jgi:heterodisulfide reductase subunit B
MTQMKYAYFPGCSAESTGIAYTESTRYIAQKIGLELLEIDDWCCCGTSAARMTDEDLSYALPARSLAMSEKQYPGLDVVAPCTGCYASLKRAAHWAREDEKNRSHVSDLIQMDYKAQSEVKSLLEIMVEPDMVQTVVDNLQQTLGGMKLACYYGCTQVRPVELCDFDSPENPTSMEGLLDAAGASCVDWAFKTECCGASNHVVSPKIARQAVERIFRNAQACGAEAIVTSCPLCWLNLDMREDQINREMGTDYHLPVYYFTELLAMAMGASPKEAGLEHHFVPATSYVLGALTPKQAEPEPEEVA